MILRTPGSTRTNPLFPDMTLFRSVVIGRVREGAATIAFTERPGPVDVGAQHVVDTDIPPAVDLHPSGAQAEIVGIGSPANGDQNVGSANHAVALKAVHSDRDAFVIGFQRKDRKSVV